MTIQTFGENFKCLQLLVFKFNKKRKLFEEK